MTCDTAVRLTLASAVTAGQRVTVAYAKPTSGPVLQDRAANAMASFTAKRVTNNTKGLTAESVAQTTATLKIHGHTGAWWYKRTAPGAGTCTSVGAGAEASLSGLIAGTRYSYKAYTAAGCTTANELGSVRFTPEFGTSSSFAAPANVTANLTHPPLPPEGCPYQGGSRANIKCDRAVPVWRVVHKLHWDADPLVSHFRYRAKAVAAAGACSFTACDQWQLLGIKNRYRIGDIGGRTEALIPDIHIVLLAEPAKGSPGDPGYEAAHNGQKYCYEVRAGDGASYGPAASVAVTAGGVQGAGGGATAQVSLTVAPNPVEEGSPVTVTATLSRALLDSVTIPLTVTRVSAEEGDVGTLPSITIDAGATSGEAAMTTAQDSDGEDETFTVALDTDGLPSSVTAGTPASVTVIIDDTATGGEAPIVLFPAAPGSLEATPGDGEVALSWSNVVGATHWEVERDGSGTWTDTGSDATTHTVTGLTNGTAYSFRVRASKFGLVPGNASESVTATPALPQAPGAVAAVRVTHKGSSLAVSWDAPSGATHYNVTYRNTGNGQHARAAWNRAGTSLTITCDSRTGKENQHCVTAGATYIVGVQARNTAGASAWTESAQASLPVPGAVAGVRVVHNGTSLAVSWDAPDHAATYNVTYTDANNVAWKRAAWAHAGTSLTIATNIADDGNAAGTAPIDAQKTYIVGVQARMRAAFRKTALVVDECSLASTVQARDLLRIADALRIPKVVLVGDEKQLDAVDAGKPFAQLQKAGMKTAVMDEIMRQRDPALKEAVEASLAGDVARAFGKLGGNIEAVKPDNLAGAAAARWLALPPEERANAGLMAPSHALRENINAIVRERLERDGTVHGPAQEAERLVSRGYTNAEKTLAGNYMPGDTVPFHRPYKRLGVEKGNELRVAGVDHRTRTVTLEGADGQSVAWEPNRLAARAGGVEVYRSDEIELRAGDRIRWTRNDAGLGLVNSATAEVAAVGDGRAAFRLEDGRMLDLAPGDPQLRHIDRAWASTVHAFQGRTVDTVIAAMEANHPNLTSLKTFYVEISRARDRAELVTDDRDALRERLEAVTGERIAALEAVGPDKAKGREAGLKAGQSAGREYEASLSRERAESPMPEMEPSRAPKGVDRELGL